MLLERIWCIVDSLYWECQHEPNRNSKTKCRSKWALVYSPSECTCSTFLKKNEHLDWQCDTFYQAHTAVGYKAIWFLGINPHNRTHLLQPDSRPHLSSFSLGSRKSKTSAYLKCPEILQLLHNQEGKNTNLTESAS